MVRHNWQLEGAELSPSLPKSPIVPMEGHASAQAQWLTMESVATLHVSGPGETAADITARLGLSPTRCVEAGGPVRPGSSKIAEGARWVLDSDAQGPGVEPNASLCALLDKTEPSATALRQLESEGYSVVWRCVVATSALEHDIEFNFGTLQRLAVLPGVLRLDVYDDDGLSENL